jgi:ribosomal protein L37AE/L43A
MKNIVSLLGAQIPSEESLWEYLLHTKVDAEGRCPFEHAPHPKLLHITTRPRIWICGSCGHNFCPTANTVFRRSPKSLQECFVYTILVEFFDMSTGEFAAYTGFSIKNSRAVIRRLKEATPETNPFLTLIGRETRMDLK